MSSYNDRSERNNRVTLAWIILGLQILGLILLLLFGRDRLQALVGDQQEATPTAQPTSAPEPTAEIHPHAAKRYGLVDGARMVLRTRRGSAVFISRISPDIRPDTIFAPFHWPGESSANRLTNDALDRVSRMPEFKVCAARIETDE